MNYAMFCEQLHNVSAGLLEKRKMQGDRGGGRNLSVLRKYGGSWENMWYVNSEKKGKAPQHICPWCSPSI